MFNKNNLKVEKNEPYSNSINIIGPGTIIKGEIKCNGDIRIDGSLIGAVISKGKIVVGNTGTVEGEINCQNADISGNVSAKIVVAELLALKATAKITGDIITSNISIEPGAVFTGNCDMNQNVKTIDKDINNMNPHIIKKESEKNIKNINQNDEIKLKEGTK
ncbi:MAG: hypothetical protein A2X12_08135 [Bacteroidetes bacterium GWE2_29_8]|nr:MAG: hypothetical protein A2X12_08135 [Bacteroidetes bacterium GWE2_29_8]OFY17514.1 MAG: hypothetical protein A2X02_05695 [Bacteroidetes bacterium GWF2_29_10]